MDWMTLINPLVTLLVGAGMIRVLWSVRGELSKLSGMFHEFRSYVLDRLNKLEERDG
jgi:hypothetical protein